MNTSQKLRKPNVVKWVSAIFSGNASKSSRPNLYYVSGSYPVRLYSSEAAIDLKNDRKLAIIAKKEVQDAVLDYLHGTRSLPFMVAEHMSRNSPKFSEGVLNKLQIRDDIGVQVRRLLRYYSIDEYELFFESIGLEPSEYTPFLPKTSVFLRDDELLLENYHALWHYGIPRKKIGRMFMEVREIFRYDYGVLGRKLRSFEELGLRQSVVAKIIASSPRLLREGANVEFGEALRRLEMAGIQNDWLEEHISEGDSYDWKVILELMCLLSKTGMTDEQLGIVIMGHGDALIEESGRAVLFLFGFLTKFGFTQGDMKNLFTQLPDMSVLAFATNLIRCYKFLLRVNMKWDDVRKIIRSYPTMLGSCRLKCADTLKFGERRLHQMILDDPNVLKKWVYTTPVRAISRSMDARILRTKFLRSMGLKNSEELKRADRVLRGRALAFQESFDCLLDLGFCRKEATGMVKVSPSILRSVYKCQNKLGLSEKLLTAMEENGDEDAGQAIWRLFLKHIGLKLSEWNLLLLDDRKLFLENCYALYDNGILRVRIGMFCKEVREIFEYDYGVLSQKLKSFKKLGLRQSLVNRIIMSSPHLLKESNLLEFVEALTKLDKAGIRQEWLVDHIPTGDSCDWKLILKFMHLLNKTGLSDEQVGKIIMEHRDILLEQNGRAVIHLIGSLVKLGFTQEDMKGIFVQLPDISVANFTLNLFRCYEFLVTINMNSVDIGNIVRLYPILLGSCNLKTAHKLRQVLYCNNKRLCEMILDDPNVLKGWVFGVEIQRQRAPKIVKYEDTVKLKTKFLLNLGFEKNSKDFKKLFKTISGDSFQERFNYYVDLGLSRDDVIRMVKMAPKILNVSKDLISRKINSFVDLGYSVSDLLDHPPIMCYTIERVKLRILVYQMLRREGAYEHRTLSTLLSPSDKQFLRRLVLCYPRGLEFWEQVKKETNA